MLRRLRAFLDWHPEGLTPFQAVRARLMWIELWALQALILVYIPAHLVMDPPRALVTVGFALQYLLALWLLRRGHQQVTAAIVIGGWLLWLAASMGPTGGIHGITATYATVGAMATMVWLDRAPAIAAITAHVLILVMHGPLTLAGSDASWMGGHSHIAILASHGVAILVGTALTGTLVDAMSEAEADADARTEEAVAARAEARHASEAKARFLATMSHELRTPLNAILGYSDLLREDGGPSAGDLDRIHAAGSQLLGLVDDVLEVARSESAPPDEHAQADLLEVLGRIGPSVARSTGASVTLQGASPTGGTALPVRCSADQLGRILRNLCAHAAASAAAVPLTLTARADTVEVQLVVPSHGPRGLRVALAQRLAEATGGRLEADPRGLALTLPRAA